MIKRVYLCRLQRQNERSYPESNRGRPDSERQYRIEVMLIRTGSDNRYTIEPFLDDNLGAVNIMYLEIAVHDANQYTDV